jgi:hypothetical protein
MRALAVMQREGMVDRSTRNYAIGLGFVLGGLAVVWILSSWDPGASKLNALLASDAELAAYPYQFRAESLKDGVATLKSPRSFDVPVIRFLAVIDPQLVVREADHPDVMAAQAALAHHQKRAQAIVEGQPEVRAVRWVLDRGWYAARGITIQ